MNPSFKDICIFTRTYAGDRELLPYLYRSIEKFVSDWGEVVLVVEEKDLEIIKPYVPHWVRIETEESFAPGTIQHKYTKLTADLYTDKEYIFHIDSDSIFFHSPNIDDLFEAGKPILEFSTYSHLLEHQDSETNVSYLRQYTIKNVLPIFLKDELPSSFSEEQKLSWLNDNFQKWCDDPYFEIWFRNWFEDWKRLYGVDIWREGAGRALGENVDFEFSRRPEKLYPRKVYSLGRDHIKKIHGVDLKNFIQTCIGIQTAGALNSLYFSDLNYIGSILWKYLQDEIAWVDIELQGIEYRKKFIKQFISYDILKDGILNIESRDLYESLLGLKNYESLCICN
jgi:hypothetical protein